MSEYKPITGELRNWFEHAYSYDVGETPWFGWKSTIEQMLDAIDSIHANLERENESLKAELDRARGKWDYWESTHVELPKDADGEYIHFGDVLDQFGTPMTVFAMSDPDPDQGDCMLDLITDGISDSMWVRARKMRHYHDPTVEDVLREFAGECLTFATCVEDHEVTDAIERFAAKLRLAGYAE